MVFHFAFLLSFNHENTKTQSVHKQIICFYDIPRLYVEHPAVVLLRKPMAVFSYFSSQGKNIFRNFRMEIPGRGYLVMRTIIYLNTSDY